jgi:hypothetical protein
VRKRTKRASIIAAVLVLAGITLGTATPAKASATQQVCTASGIQCINAWNGFNYGNQIKMYYNDNTDNNNFGIYFVYGRCGVGNDHVTVNVKLQKGCPFSNWKIDYELESDPIVQIAGTHGCVADPNWEGFPTVGNCNDPNTGSGGSNATLFVIDDLYLHNCTAGQGGETLTSVGWTNRVNDGNAYVLYTGDGLGTNAGFAVSDGNPTCWVNIG